MISLDALEALARRAADNAPRWDATTRQGSWDWLIYSQDDPNIEICQMFHDNTELNEGGEANARFIAACDPQTILELVKLARRGERE